MSELDNKADAELDASEETELDRLVDKVDPNRRPIASQIVAELDFMADTLGKLKKEIVEKGVVDNFNQGKQHFMRESPALKSYNTTISRYAVLFKQLCELLPDGATDDDDELEQFINDCGDLKFAEPIMCIR